MRTGEKIQALRKAAGLTQAQLAERLFVSRELVSKWELGQRRPDIRALGKMAALFAVPVEELADLNAFINELQTCLPPDLRLDAALFSALLQAFLGTLSVRDRGVFLRRYYALEVAAAIGEAFGLKENHVRSVLARTRKKLKNFLKGAKP